MTEMILLSDAQMARISPFFPLSHGVPRVDDRRVISGIIFVIRNGLRWRDVPASYGLTRQFTTASSAGARWACSGGSLSNLPKAVVIPKKS
jgi:transposase